MKIIYATNVRLPTEKAHGVQIMQMCSALAELGHEVVLVAPRRLNSAGDPFSFYGLAPKFRIEKLNVIDLLTNHPSRLTFFLEQLSFAAQIWFQVLKRSAHIWYTRDEIVAAILGMLGKKMIVEVHRLPQRVWWLRRLGKKSMVVATTAALAQALRSLVAPEVRIVVAHDGVDLAQYINTNEPTAAARAKLNLKEAPTIIYVGRLETMGMEKGLNDLLLAFVKVVAVNSGTQLVIVGGPENSIQELNARAAELGLKNNINFVGQVAHQKIPAYLAAADIAAMPFPDTEHYRYWMSPLKLFEYLAAGKAIISSDLPAVREVVNEQTVVFIPPSNPEALAGAINNLISDETTRQKLGERAREQATNYSWRARAEKIISF